MIETIVAYIIQKSIGELLMILLWLYGCFLSESWYKNMYKCGINTNLKMLEIVAIRYIGRILIKTSSILLLIY